mgnify:CR=1 FL=1
MGRRYAALIAVLSLLFAVLLVPTGWTADRQVNNAPPIFEPVSKNAQLLPTQTASTERITVMIELASAPVAALPDTLHRSQRIRIQNEQQTLQRQLPQLGATVLFSTRLAYNGIAVSINADRIDQLRQLPGINALHVIPPKEPNAFSSKNAALLAQVAQTMQEGITGRGVRIGVIDSGIDYTHATFGGPGTPAAYSSNNPSIIEAGSFPTARVVGGFDFAGDAYDASSPDPARRIPQPDADPLDCNGHGTYVASLLAGQGVLADGSPYTGPYPIEQDQSAFSLLPGVAPEAELYALKIFGCEGSSVLMIPAIEYALDPNGDGDTSDRLDILNISTGSGFGSNDDPDAIAVNNAVQAGIVVVASAGDLGNTFYSVNSPASANHAIAVGATVDQTTTNLPAPGIMALAPQEVASYSSRGPQRGNQTIKPELVAPGTNIPGAAIGSGTGTLSMSGTSGSAAQVAGAAALLLQQHPDWQPNQVKAALLNTASPVSTNKGALYPPSLVGAGQLNLSALSNVDLLASTGDLSDTATLSYGAPWISQPWSQAQPLFLQNESNLTRTVTLSVTTVVSETGVTVELPATQVEIEPHSSLTLPISVTVDPSELTATFDAFTPPTQNNFARYGLAEHSGYVHIHSDTRGNETRVRAAHAAHFRDVDMFIDDLLLDESLDSREVQEYYTVEPGQHTVYIRLPNKRTVVMEVPVDLAAGRDYSLVMVGRPDELGLLVVDETAPSPPPGQSLIHFLNANRVGENWDIGPLDVYIDGELQLAGLGVGQVSAYQPIAPGTYTITFYQAGSDPQTTRRVSHKTIEVQPNKIILFGTGRHDDDDKDLYDLEQRTFMGVEEPYQRAEPQTLRVPFQIFPKSASEARATNSFLILPPGTNTFSLDLINTGARNAGLVNWVGSAQTPLVSAFELAASSPQIPNLNTSLQAADVKYVGVTSNYGLVGQVDLSVLFFGLANYAPWSTPNEIQFRTYIDSNLDGIDDYVIINTNSNSSTWQVNDVFVNVVYRILPDGQWSPIARSSWNTWPAPASASSANLDSAPFNSSVMFQAVGASQIGLTSAQPRIRYYVETYARDANYFNQRVDRVPATGALEYNLLQAGITPINGAVEFGQRPLFVDTHGSQISGFVNSMLVAMRQNQKLLLLHHHNRPEQQAELIDLYSVAESRLYNPDQRRVMLPMVVLQ